MREAKTRAVRRRVEPSLVAAEHLAIESCGIDVGARWPDVRMEPWLFHLRRKQEGSCDEQHDDRKTDAFAWVELHHLSNTAGQAIDDPAWSALRAVFFEYFDLRINLFMKL